MANDYRETEIIEADGTKQSDCVMFDSDLVTLIGVYSDEISAHRARKLWMETFADSFLLESKSDYTIVVSRDESGKFLLNCVFESACGRYAFWRLTNNQAPEAQYIIETAHIPLCDSHQEEIIHAPDLRSIHDEPNTTMIARLKASTGLPSFLKSLVSKIQ